MKKSELRKIIKEEIQSTLKEGEEQGTIQHHLEQIEDDLTYGDFSNMDRVDSFLNGIIDGIYEIKARQREMLKDKGDGFEAFMKNDHPDGDY